MAVAATKAARAVPEGVRQEAHELRAQHAAADLVECGVLGLAAWLWIWAAFIAKGIGLLRRLPQDAARERALVVGSLAAIVGFSSAASPSTTSVTRKWCWSPGPLMALPWVADVKEPRESSLRRI